MKPFIFSVVFLALLHLSVGIGNAAESSQQQLIGFVEGGNQQALRVAFQKTKNGWRSLCSPEKNYEINDCRLDYANKELAWNVIFGGKPIGKVKTEGYLPPEFYSQVGLAKISSSTPAPHEGNKSDEYSGWMDEPVYRPLVAITMDYFADTEGWRPAKSQKDDLLKLWPYFKKAAGQAANCKSNAAEDEVTWDYSRKDVVFVKAFASKKGARLIGLEINPNLYKCDGPQSKEWSTFWFVITSKKYIIPLQPQYRDSTLENSVYDMTPIDFGNYDGNGSSVVLFRLSAYDEDGYVMFYDNFAKSVSFTWIYH